MEELVIRKKRGTQYVFSKDSITLMKEDRVKLIIYLSDVRKIRYQPDFDWLEFFDLLRLLMGSRLYKSSIDFMPPHAFDIYVKTQNCKRLRLWLSPEQFEKVKKVLAIPVIYY